MKTLTIRGVNAPLYQLLQKESRRAGVSMNRFVVRALERVLGSKRGKEKYHDLDALLGSWSEEDLRAFKKATAPFEEIDSELWK